MLTIPWRTGVNMREFAYYGTHTLRTTDPENRPDLQEFQLATLRDIGVKLVRFFASHRDFETPETINRLRTALQKIKDFQMQAIVCLDDSVRDSGYFVRGNTEFMSTWPLQHYDKSYYNDHLYRKHYLPQVEAIVSAFKNDPTIFCWELGNELALHPQMYPEPREGMSAPVPRDADGFFEFAKETSTKIKQISPNHLVSTGLMSVRHVISFEAGQDPTEAARRLYKLPTIDLISIHFYEENGLQTEQDMVDWDFTVAQNVEKPFYVGEVGANNFGINRVAYHHDAIERWKNRGACAALVWQFNASPKDLFISDGMARMHGDFDGLVQVVRGFAAGVQPFLHQGQPPIVEPDTSENKDGATRAEPPPVRFFRVVREDVVIFTQPNIRSAQLPGTLKVGKVIEVNSNSRKVKDGQIWWQFDDAWIIERADTRKPKKSEANLVEVTHEAIFGVGRLTPSSPNKPKPNLHYEVVAFDGAKIRRTPALNGKKLGLLEFGARIEVFADSRREVNGYVWWQHALGWSAERAIEVAAGSLEAIMHKIQPAAFGAGGSSSPDVVRFQVGFKNGLNVRSDPSKRGDENHVGDLLFGDLVESKVSSRTVSEGMIWWQHDNGRDIKNPGGRITGGWTAERSEDSADVFMLPDTLMDVPGEIETFYQNPDDMVIDVNQLPGRGGLFRVIPADMSECFTLQLYGNTREAFESCRYRKVFQGLHPGLDLGVRGPAKDTGTIEVRAGVAGEVEKILRDVYTPVGVIIAAGPYKIIYGHLSPDGLKVSPGQKVGPETPLGHIANQAEIDAFNATGPKHKLFFWPHLHLEIRYVHPSRSVTRVLNPLIFFSGTFRSLLTKGVKPDHFFVQEGAWTEWDKPMRQPLIRVGDHPPLGPLSVLASDCTG